MSPPAALEVEAVTDTIGVTKPYALSKPIKSNEINGRRRKTEKTQWVTAAHADSASFRHRNYDDRPLAKRWDRMYRNLVYLSERTDM
jgi:aromatic amino acid aminotransferase I / 2-aminoadipate transaminase